MIGVFGTGCGFLSAGEKEFLFLSLLDPYASLRSSGGFYNTLKKIMSIEGIRIKILSHKFFKQLMLPNKWSMQAWHLLCNSKQQEICPILNPVQTTF